LNTAWKKLGFIGSMQQAGQLGYAGHLADFLLPSLSSRQFASFDASGAVNFVDFLAFRNRFGSQLNFE